MMMMWLACATLSKFGNIPTNSQFTKLPLGLGQTLDCSNWQERVLPTSRAQSLQKLWYKNLTKILFWKLLWLCMNRFNYEVFKETLTKGLVVSSRDVTDIASAAAAAARRRKPHGAQGENHCCPSVRHDPRHQYHWWWGLSFLLIHCLHSLSGRYAPRGYS